MNNVRWHSTMNVDDSIFRALAIMSVTVGAFIPQKNIKAKSMIYNPYGIYGLKQSVLIRYYRITKAIFFAKWPTYLQNSKSGKIRTLLDYIIIVQTNLLAKNQQGDIDIKFQFTIWLQKSKNVYKGIRLF